MSPRKLLSGGHGLRQEAAVHSPGIPQPREVVAHALEEMPPPVLLRAQGGKVMVGLGLISPSLRSDNQALPSDPWFLVKGTVLDQATPGCKLGWDPRLAGVP